MEEVFPVASGVVLGLAVPYLVQRRFRGWVLGGSSVLLGVTASWISGELAVSWFYPVIDVAQVLAAGAMTGVLAARWRRFGGAAPQRDV
ncbi:MAG TPA: hypothetical protein VGW35_12655 [Methylomirabilota bacterium]|jgi:hypothetical protein|nr:hypothetical protein [Methylomirabilota bacterium]